MAFTSSSAAGSPMADINVTPLVDVMLVLLVVFMITAPMLAAGMKVDLPRASTAKPLPPVEPIVVTVGRDGALAIGTDPIDRDGLVAAVRTRSGGDTDRSIRIRGDREAPYGDVVEAIDRLAAAGFGHIALVSRKPAANEPSPAPGSPVPVSAAPVETASPSGGSAEARP